MQAYKEDVPASVLLVVVGIVVAGLGAALAGGGPGSSALGSGLVAVGALLFGLGILIEFFSIGSNLRRIAHYSARQADDDQGPDPRGRPAA